MASSASPVHHLSINTGGSPLRSTPDPKIPEPDARMSNIAQKLIITTGSGEFVLKIPRAKSFGIGPDNSTSPDKSDNR